MKSKTKKKQEPNKIAIFGLAYDGGTQIFEDESFSIWSMNSAFKVYPRLDYLFDMHDWQSSEYEAYYFDELMLEEKRDFKIILPRECERETDNEVIAYPWVDIGKEIPFYNSCSLTYMLAYALVEFDLPIYLFGFNNAEITTHPYMLQNFYYLLGYARARHRDIYITTNRTFDDALYNYGIGMKLKDADRERGFLMKYRIKDVEKAKMLGDLL